MRKNLLLKAAILLGAFCVGFTAAADNEFEAPRKVRVGFFAYSCCHELNERGEPCGYGYDIIEKVAEVAGWNVEYVGYDKTWGDMLPMLERGELDIVDFAGYQPGRELKFAYSRQPTAYSGCSIRTLPENRSRFPVGGYHQWGEIRVGGMAGDQNNTEFARYAAEHNLTYKFTEYEEEPLAIEAMKRGELDMVAFDGFAAQAGLVTIEEFHPVGNYLMTRRDDAELMTELNDAFTRLEREDPGWLVRIRAKYFPLKTVICYIPEGEERDRCLGEYCSALLYRLAEIAGLNIVQRPCPADFSGIDQSEPCIVCGVDYSTAKLKSLSIPLHSAGRRRVDLYALPGSDLAHSGVAGAARALRVGSLRDEGQYLNSFLRFAADERLAFSSEIFDDPAELEAALRSSRIDMIVRPASPIGALAAVSDCGYRDFYFAAPTEFPEIGHAMSEAIKHLRLHSPDIFTMLERRFFGTSHNHRRKVRIGTYTTHGLARRDANGELQGFNVDFFRDVARRCKWNTEFQLMTYADARRALEEGAIDTMGAVADSDERPAWCDYSELSMGPLEYALLGRASGRMKPNRPDTWKNASIGVVHGSSAAVELEKLMLRYGVSWTKHLYQTSAAAEAAVRRGEIDAAVSLLSPDNHDLEPLRIIPTRLCYVCTSHDKPWLKEDIDRAVSEMLRENPDYFVELRKRHFADSSKIARLDDGEINFLRDFTGRRINIAFSDLTPPLAQLDDNGELTGFYRMLFDIIAQASGLNFAYVQNLDEADVVLSTDNRTLDAGKYVANRNWLNSVCAFVSRRGAADAESVRLVATIGGFPGEAEYLANSGYEIRRFETRDACYRALDAGLVEKVFDNISVARTVIESQRRYHDFKLEEVSTAEYSRPATLYVRSELDSNLRSILDKYIATVSEMQLGNILFKSIYSQREDVITVDTVINWILGVSAVGLLLFLYMHFRAIRLKRHRDEIAAALRLAETASRSKTEFLSNMSHDIRTPMNAIAGFAMMIRRSIDNRGKVLEFLGKIELAGQHLLQLINEVLDMSRIESGRVELKPIKSNLVRLMEATRLICEENAGRKNIKIKFDFSATQHADVILDEVRFNQVILNIIGNAVKYTPEGGRVEVVSSEAESPTPGCVRHRFRVSDNGIGMSEDFVKKIFEPFSRENNTTMSKVEGTGLGMSIVKRIIELMNGSIEIASRRGEGTTVTVTFDLPLAPADAAETVEESYADVKLEGCRILLVDDNEMNREIARFALESQQLVVDEANDGAAAVEKFIAADGAYDAVLMDVQMPVMNGHEAAMKIRAWEQVNSASKPRRATIIAMTANAFTEDREQALAAGMDDHLGKPVVVDTLMKTLRRHLRRAEVGV